jgi:hypothetical protein
MRALGDDFYNPAMIAGRFAALTALALALALPRAATADDFSSAVIGGFERLRADPPDDETPVAAFPDRVDLSAQWADGPREQAPLAACHDFAAVALLEAGYFRATGRRLRLSEADLFARGTALRGLRSVLVRENGILREDLRFALAEGVMTGDGYAAFAKNYKNSPRLTPLKGERKGLERILPQAATPEAAADRARAREELGVLRVGGPGFLRFFGSAARVVLKGGAVRCRGRDRRRNLLQGRLAAGQPVGVGLLLNAVSDPGLHSHEDAAGGEHYLVVSGYERRDSGVVFTLRNSWDHRPGGNAELTESDLCAVFGISWISAPGESD